MSTMALQVEGIRSVTGSAERTIVFPVPLPGQKVYNQSNGCIEEWSGSAWQPIFTGSRGAISEYNVRNFGAVGDGVTDDSAAIQAAITQAAAGGVGVRVGRVFVPVGVYAYATGLTVPGGVIISGAGGPSSEDGGFATVPTTELKYTGNGVAISLLGTPAQGHTNIHLRDFLLRGNVNATGGILCGSASGAASLVHQSSIKRVAVRDFTKVGAYGLKFRRMLTSVMENVLAKDCYDGFLFDSESICTTLTFINCYAGTCIRNGLRFATPQNVTGLAFHLFVSESSGADGVYLYGASFTTFYGLYCEDNNLTGGTAPVFIGGSSLHLKFYAPYIQSPVAGRSFDLDAATRILIHYPIVETLAAGWCRVTANTTDSQLFLLENVGGDTITGNAPGRMQVLGSKIYEEGTWVPVDLSGAGLVFTAVSATYERHGRTVIARCALTYPATANGANAVIGGLPYALAGSDDARQAFVSYTSEGTLARMLPSGSQSSPVTSGAANITNATLSGDTIFFTVIYRV